MSDRLEALEASAAHLATLQHGLSGEELASLSYASEWTFADVASHLGSGAAFIRLVYGRLDAGHTPVGYESATLEQWRALFQGV